MTMTATDLDREHVTHVPAPNVALLDKTLDYIYAHPEEWDQAYYRCGTTCCFAGHAAILSGGEWVNGCEPILFADHEDEAAGNAFIDRDDEGKPIRVVHVEDRAARALGLTGEETDDLFDGSNNLDDLQRVVDKIKARA